MSNLGPWACKACGSRNGSITFVEEEPAGLYLKIHCRTCGYEGREPPLFVRKESPTHYARLRLLDQLEDLVDGHRQLESERINITNIATVEIDELFVRVSDIARYLIGSLRRIWG